jgi:hypothetical protein
MAGRTRGRAAPSTTALPAPVFVSNLRLLPVAVTLAIAVPPSWFT